MPLILFAMRKSGVTCHIYYSCAEFLLSRSLILVGVSFDDVIPFESSLTIHRNSFKQGIYMWNTSRKPKKHSHGFIYNICFQNHFIILILEIA